MNGPGNLVPRQILPAEAEEINPHGLPLAMNCAEAHRFPQRLVELRDRRQLDHARVAQQDVLDRATADPTSPALDEVVRAVDHEDVAILVDGGQIAKAAGNLRAQNMVAVGAASCRLDFPEELLLKHVEALFARKGAKIVEVNRLAFRYGRAAGLFFRGLVDAGTAIPTALGICQRIDPSTFDPALAGDWAKAVSGGGKAAPSILETDEAVACDSVPVGA